MAQIIEADEPPVGDIIHSRYFAANDIVAVLGFCLFLSGLIWPSSRPALWSTWLVGLVFMTFGLLARSGVLRMRYVDLAASVWLLLSAFIFSHVTVATVWSNTITAVVALVASLVIPDRSARRAIRQEPQAA